MGDDPPVEAFLDRYGLSSLQELTTHSPSDNQTAIQPLICAEDDQNFGRATDPFLGNPPLSLSLRHNSASLIIRVIAPGETLLRDDEKDTILTRGVNGLRVFGDHADAATSKRGPRSGSLVVSHLKQDFRLLRFLLKGGLPRRSIQSHAGRSGLELSKMDAGLALFCSCSLQFGRSVAIVLPPARLNLREAFDLSPSAAEPYMNVLAFHSERRCERLSFP
jgi:hypothetical protein